jgi:hypothetical protein
VPVDGEESVDVGDTSVEALIVAESSSAAAAVTFDSIPGTTVGSAAAVMLANCSVMTIDTWAIASWMLEYCSALMEDGATTKRDSEPLLAGHKPRASTIGSKTGPTIGIPPRRVPRHGESRRSLKIHVSEVGH